ncbi:patatin-like phospholipase family protein [Bdellovibrio svalbardensis]|uniref:Alpha/beta hydrolase n=1 Tax=Bdellovibrio svalbardensis TaxID=2972972 RepID=A0ABT6DE08_9BACT|nr:patatin-like phospholipase family protein [Bdellovibrio svalbardensis]MDG0814764.1 alpha/beta hydrolase [Bdellovibrio svalbardensis]
MSSLFSQKNLRANKSWFLALLVLAGCQSVRTREDIRKSTQPSSSHPSTSAPSAPREQQQPTPVPVTQSENIPQTTEMAPPPLPAPVIPALPKIGIILGAGGAKTYAHIGFLHELAKFKVPVYAIGGIELATPMAALYANRELANDVEWQMFKLKDDQVVKKSLLGSVHKNNEVSLLKDFANTAFNKAKVEDFKLPFACPSYNMKKNQVFLMNRGSLEQILYFCMAYPPFFQPYQGNISAIRDVTALANYLRSKGANYIVLVNVLQPPGGAKPFTLDTSATDNVLWSEISGVYNKPLPGVDSVISLDTSEYGIMDFDKRREIMNKGAESAAKQLKSLTRKWGI